MFRRELVKGSTSILVLQLLLERDMYGYELAKEINQRSDQHLEMKEGSLYPDLHKLEKQEYVEHYWKKQTKGPDRKYYLITAQGENLYTNVPTKLIDKRYE